MVLLDGLLLCLHWKGRASTWLVREAARQSAGTWEQEGSEGLNDD